MRFSLFAQLLLFPAMFANIAAASALPEHAVPGIEAVTIAPHRALYDMALASVKNGSSVSDVSGTMLFEWGDVCDGWAIQQKLHLRFSHAEGDESDVASNEVTWESKDGKQYNFNIRRTSDGKETENYRGKATTGEKANAAYVLPEKKTVDLTAATIFPSTHTRQIIAAAKSGQRFFTRRVFDGTEQPGSDDVSVFIGPSVAHKVEAAADDKLAGNPLLTAAAWPVHMAFFKLDDETGAPDYEMDMQLLANGVVRSLRIDYGDFSVTGTLKALEPLPAPHC